MVPIRVNGALYECPDSLDEVSLARMGEVQKLVRGLPDPLRERYSAMSEEVKPINDEAAHTEFCRVLLSLLSGIPREITDNIKDEDICGMEQVFMPIILFSLGMCNPTGIKGFSHLNRTYYLPGSDKDIMGEEMPLSGCTAREFCEASDIAALDNLDFAPLLVGTLCKCSRKEAYSTKAIKERAELFRDIPASVYAELLSRLFKAHSYMESEYKECYRKGGKSGGGRSTWGDRLLFAANDLPSELPIVEKMPCYDFMNMLNGKMRRAREQWGIR